MNRKEINPGLGDNPCFCSGEYFFSTLVALRVEPLPAVPNSRSRRAVPNSRSRSFEMGATLREMLQESPFVQVGISEPGHKGGHDESGHSSSSIISKTLTGLSYITPADPNTSSEETYSIPDSPDPNVSDQETDSIIDSVESLPDSDYGGDPMDADEQNPMDYIREIYAVVEGAIQTNNLDGVIDSINSLRDSYDMSDGDCVHHMFYCMMKSALEAPYDSVEFNKHIEEMLSNWKDVLTYFISWKLSELDLIRVLEMICSEIPTSFSPFLKTLTCLYENGIVSKHAILYWAYRVGCCESGLDDTFMNQSSELIKMLTEEPHNRVVPENYFHSEIEEEELFMEQEINCVVRVYEEMEVAQCLYYGHPSNI